MAGVATLADFVALAGAPLLGPNGELVAGLPMEGARLILLAAAAAAAGSVSSLAARDYVSGTSVLAVSSGLLLRWLGAHALHPGRPLPDTLDPAQVAIETVDGLVILLAGYVAAWQTDLRWVLPRRPGPASVPKRVPPREVLLRNLPALGLAAAVAYGLGALALSRCPGGVAAAAAWLASASIAAAATQAIFRLRSTFFLWTAPSVAILVAGFAPGSAWRLWWGVPLGCLAPVGALGAALGYLVVPSRGVAPSVGGASQDIRGLPGPD